MAFDKVVDSAELDASMTATAEAIRAKTGKTEPFLWEAKKGFANAIAGIETGGGVEMGEITLGTVTDFSIPVSSKKTYLIVCVPNITEMMANNKLNYCRVLFAVDGGGQVQAHSNKAVSTTTMTGNAYWSAVTSDYAPVFTDTEIRLRLHTAGIDSGKYLWFAW